MVGRAAWLALVGAALIAPEFFVSACAAVSGPTGNQTTEARFTAPSVRPLPGGTSDPHVRGIVGRPRGKPPCLAWVSPDGEPKAALLCVHGLGLNSKSYEDFGKRMSGAGVATYAVDVRGFGSWINNRGHENVDFDGCLCDVADTLRVIHRVYPGKPVFILGESMGGAIALRATAMYPDLVDGLISCVPAGDRFKQFKESLQVAVHALHGFNHKFDVGRGVVEQASAGKDEGTANKTLEREWLSDPLNKLELSPRELIQFQRFMNDNHDFARKVKATPVLMVQGADDNLVKAAGTLELLQNTPVDNRDIELVIFRDARHLIFEEAESNDQRFNEKVFRLVDGWIDDHLRTAACAANPGVSSNMNHMKVQGEK